MSQTAAEIEARLLKVRAAMNTILDGGVAEFQLEGQDRAVMLSLSELQRMEQHLEKQLARLQRGPRARFVRGWRY